MFLIGNTNSFNTSRDILITKYNELTGVISSKIFYSANPIQEESTEILHLSDGNLLLLCQSINEISLIKLDINLNQISRYIFQAPEKIYGTSILETNNGDIIITGYENYFGDTKDLIIKLNSSLEINWAKYFDSGNNSKALLSKYNNQILISGYNSINGIDLKSSFYLIDNSGSLLFSKIKN